MFIQSIILFAVGSLVLPSLFPGIELPRATFGLGAVILHALVIALMSSRTSLAPDHVDREDARAIIACITISKKLSYAHAAYVATMVFVFFTTIMYLLQLHNNNTLILIACGLGSIVTVSNGIRQIPIAHVGLPLWFGGRSQEWGYLYGEGYVWTPWPLMSVEAVSVEEKPFDQPNFTIVVGGKSKSGNGNSSTIDTEGALMEVDLTFFYMIWNPWRFKDVERSLIAELNDVIESGSRRVGTRMHPIEFILARKELSDAVRKDLVSQTARWGLVIFNLNVKKIKFADMKLQERYEAMVGETMQRRSEQTEAFRFEMARDLCKKLNLKATARNINMIVDRLQIEAEKVKKTIHQFEGETSPLNTASAIWKDNN